MASFTLNIAYGKVVGFFPVLTGDGVDSDVYPDGMAPTGTVTFTPSVSQLLVAGLSPDPATIELLPITATIDSGGYLSFNGARGVWLAATDSTLTNPTGFTYKVKCNITYSSTIVDNRSFDIAVPTSDLTNGPFTDLAKAAPVPSSTGAFITKGDVGPAGPAGSLVPGTVTAGPLGMTISPPTAGGQQTLSLTIPTGGGSGTVTSVAGVSPDGSGNVALTKASVGLGNVDNTADASKSFTASQISDATTLSRQILQASTAAAIRSLTGAGTSNLAIGTTAGTAADASTVALASQLASYALLANPTFTGNVGVPNRTAGDNNTYAANTAFVQAAIAGLTASTPNTGIVGYNATTHTWPSRPSTSGPVMWMSTNDPSAAQPAAMVIGDSWVQHPDAVS